MFIRSIIVGLLILSFFSCKIALAGKVDAINSSKALVKVKKDTPDEFQKNNKVCFYTLKNKKISCGTVVSVKKDYVVVQVSSSVLPKIKKGMIASLDKSFDKGVTSDVYTKSQVQQESLGKKWIIALGQSSSFFTSASYNQLGYHTPDEGSGGVSELWVKEKEIKTAVVGGAFKLIFKLASKFNLDIGAHYYLYTSEMCFVVNCNLQITAQYSYNTNPAENMKYVEVNTILGSILGGHLGVSFPIMSNNNLLLLTSAGLNLDISSISFEALQKDDTDGSVNNPIAKFSSSLNVISLKLGMSFYYFIFNNFGYYSALDLLVPIYGKAKSSVSCEDPHQQLMSSSESEEIVSDVNHAKRTYALNITLLGISLRF